MRDFQYKFILGLMLWAVVCVGALAEVPKHEGTATSTSDPAIPLDELKLKLEPLTSDELFVEADGWLALVKRSVEELNQALLEVKQQNRQIDKAESKAEQATSSPAATDEAEQAADAKKKELEVAAKLRGRRTEMIDRLDLVLRSIDDKIGLTDKGLEKDEVLPYRRYIDAVSGIKLDVSDAQAVWSAVTEWLLSGEGGIHWAKQIGLFILSIVAFWWLGKLLSRLAEKALAMANNASVILKSFIVKTVQRVALFIGILVGLAALEVNVAPLLALIGAAGFVIAFALQDTLSNFASGMMIMLYKPFDVGDLVDVAGVVGKVRSMTLFTTTIMTMDNKLMVVPNNSIWGNVITNSNGSQERRVDLVFGIGYDDDIDQAQKVLEQIVAAHPKVLKQPDTVIQLHELADSSVNFICRPWVHTPDYWDVYWDITRAVKQRFDAEGISIPFPQRDVHIHNLEPVALQPVVPPWNEVDQGKGSGVEAQGMDDDGPDAEEAAS